MPSNFAGDNANVRFHGDYYDYGSIIINHASDRRPGSISSTTKWVYVPPRQVSPRFTGQQIYLDQLQEYFATQIREVSIHENSQRGGRRSFVLYGKGGVGKTQLALMFAEQHWEKFWRVFWIDASSAETMEQSLMSMAEDPEARAHGVQANSSNSVLRWLSTCGENWLLIYDNADGDPDVVGQYIPTGTKGNFLFTSRNPNLAWFIPNKDIFPVEVVDMTEDDATLLLLKCVSPGESSSAVKLQARLIAKELHCLPLAVDQAGAAIKRGMCAIGDYLSMFSSHRKELMRHPSLKGASNYGYAVYVTWDLSYQVIQTGSSGACSFMSSTAAESALLILEIFPFFHYVSISEEILKRAAESPTQLSWTRVNALGPDSDTGETSSTKNNDALQGLAHRLLLLDGKGKWDPYYFRQGIEVLSSFSLIKVDPNGASYSMHPLVHAWSRDRMTEEDRKIKSRTANTLLARSITWDFLSADYTFRRNLIPHIHSGQLHASETGFLVDEVLVNFGLAYHENGLFREAERLRVEAVERRKSELGERHPTTLECMHRLAETYRSQGRYQESVELGRKVSEMREKVLGAESPETLESMHELAVAYFFQGLYTEAEKLQFRVLESRKTVLGTHHRHTLGSMNDLAIVYRPQGRYKEAEELQALHLELCKVTHGEEHPETLTSMGNLADTYCNQGRYEEAKELQVQVLESRKQVLGEEHPATLTSMGNLAHTYYAQGRYKEAEELQVQVLESRKQVLGEEHLDTLTSMDNLANIYDILGRHKEAEKLEVQVLDSRKKVLGEEHPDTLTSMANLALIYYSQGRYNEAEEPQVRVLQLRKKVLGEEHPKTLTSMNNLAMTWKHLGKDTNALALVQEAVDLYMKVLGSDHPNTIVMTGNLEWMRHSGDAE